MEKATRPRHEHPGERRLDGCSPSSLPRGGAGGFESWYGRRSRDVTSAGLASCARRLLELAADLAVPADCLSCGRNGATRSAFGLCPSCRSRLLVHEGRRCVGCADALVGPTLPADRRCAACRWRPPPWKRLITLWDYAPPAEDLLRALKFHRVEGLAPRIAEEVWDRHAETLADLGAVVAVPVPWTRRLARGYNQSEAIARPLAARLGLELRHPLRRALSGPLSGADPAERRRRARASLRMRRRARLPGRVLLVDDVMTTGATLSVATRLLRRCGAREVVALAPFWTPPHAAKSS